MIGHFSMDDCTLTNVSNLVIEESCGEEFFLNREFSSYLAKCSFSNCTALVCNSTHGYLCFRHHLLSQRYISCGYTNLADQIELEGYDLILDKLIAWYSNTQFLCSFESTGRAVTRSTVAELERRVFGFYSRFPLESFQALHPFFRTKQYLIPIFRFWNHSPLVLEAFTSHQSFVSRW